MLSWQNRVNLQMTTMTATGCSGFAGWFCDNGANSTGVDMDTRYQQLCQWLSQKTGIQQPELTPVAGDASFRRYFRLQTAQGPRIVMDAPPPHEDCTPFVSIARQWFRGGIAVPEVLAEDLEQGFLLLEDLGDHQLLPLLNKGEDAADPLYREAISVLLDIQQQDAGNLPAYDTELLMRELELFREWFCEQWLGLTLSDTEHQQLDRVFEYLTRAALNQPQVTVHRDYHSRNLMLTSDADTNANANAVPVLGIIDFQDAVKGPVTYDLLSLLRDAYIQWPVSLEHRWRDEFWQQWHARGQCPSDYSQTQFNQDFDLIGAQRHIKVVGIFARLWLRDGKSGYLGDIPRTFHHLLHDCEGYPELTAFHQWLKDKILPLMEQKQQAVMASLKASEADLRAEGTA